MMSNATMSNKTSPVVTSLIRGAAVAGGAVALLAVFGAGTATAINEYEGMTYSDAANAVYNSGGTPVISSKVGSFLPTSQCMVTGSHKGSFLDSSGNNSGSKVMLDLNCNYMFALPGVPGNSKASPEGKAAYDQAVQQAERAQQQAQAEQEAAAQGEG
ncbi:MAG: hypothetical protein QG655_362 [Actinomycetota bacterium]|nr:hypothetical protein [Actinomycetota bacterium]